MIIVTIDPDGLYKDTPTALFVRNELEFVNSRLKIRDAIRMKKAIKVVVKSRKFGQWYESLKDYSGVKINVVSRTTVLLEELNLSSGLFANFPLNTHEIKELRLIEEARENPPRTSLRTIKDVENWVLSICIDECWSKKGGALTHLSEMASFFLSMEEYVKHPALKMGLLV